MLLQGFRVVPFIAQVCRKWKELLATRQAQVRAQAGSVTELLQGLGKLHCSLG